MSPNIVNVTNILGQTALVKPTISGIVLVTNPAASDKVFKANSLLVSNITDSDIFISVSITRAATEFFIIKEAVIPANSTLVPITKDMGIYLQEEDTVKVYASADTSSDCVLSYEEIS